MKRPHLCTVCDQQCFEVMALWPDDSPLAGEPRRVGRPTPDAVRVDLVLTDGTRTTFTVHDRCVETLEETLPAAWRKMLERMRWERKHHKALGQKPFTPEQLAHADAVNLALVHNVPLGVLAVERWVDHG